jgi:hypothetical protein
MINLNLLTSYIFYMNVRLNLIYVNLLGLLMLVIPSFGMAQNNCEENGNSAVTSNVRITSTGHLSKSICEPTAEAAKAEALRRLLASGYLKDQCREDNDPINLCRTFDCPNNGLCKADKNDISIGTDPTFTTVQRSSCGDGKFYWDVTFPAYTTNLYCQCKCIGESCTPDKGTKKGYRKSPTDDSIPCDDGSLIRLSKLTAKPTNEGILLNWNTKAEPDSQGFRMWRAIPNLANYCGCSGNIDNYTQIQVLDKEGKPILIPAKGNETSGFDYSYLDEGAKPGIAYCYALEDIDSKGESKFYFEYVAFTQDNLEKSE